MTATIERIGNERHLAAIRAARRERGLPVILAQHPFAALPFWSKVR